MPRGDKNAYTSKQKRQARDIEKSYERSGVPEKESGRRAWATVNKLSGGGKQSGSGRKKSVAKKSVAKKSIPKKANTKKASTKKTVAKKSTVRKSAASAKSPASRPQAKPAARTTRKKSVAAANPAPRRTQAAKRSRNKKSVRPLSAKARKNLASKHLWDRVAEKNRLALQLPAWQLIEHHDHPAPASGNPTALAQTPDHAAFDIQGHRDRGGE